MAEIEYIDLCKALAIFGYSGKEEQSTHIQNVCKVNQHISIGLLLGSASNVQSHCRYTLGPTTLDETLYTQCKDLVA